MSNMADSTWAFMRGYYYPKFIKVIKSLEWDERYEWLKEIYNDRHPNNLWEERSDDPVKDMMEYVVKKDYFHFFCMAVTVEDNGSYRIHRMLSKAVYNFLRNDIK
mgnify:FL=1|jgi:hypothetical protein|tara:strand:+ start:1838 stop:2152 length:315 start_codon:yes stop_codon:yes gene_type:complete